MFFSSTFKTGFGDGIVFANNHYINRVILPSTNSTKPAQAGFPSSSFTAEVADMLEQYFNGIPQKFEKIDVVIELSSSFRKTVLESIRRIPFGSVMSYAEVAAMAGYSTAARAVGGAMAANPVPIIIPCHRVVSANGFLTGFSAPGGLLLKEYLLKMESVEFYENLSKVNMHSRNESASRLI